MVTKQEQLEWLAKNHESWPYRGPVMIMSDKSIGAYYGSPKPGCHFVDFTEWQQERDKMQKQGEKADSWYERGELPPVGCECEWVDESGVDGAAGAVYPDIGCVVSICAHKQTPGGDVIAIFTWEPGGDGLSVAASRMPSDFRPLRTEREKAIDALIEIILAGGYFTSRDGAASKIAERIYDAGLLK